MSVVGLIERVRGLSDCEVSPAGGLPQIEPPFVLPDDLKGFYELCGGLTLYKDSSYTVVFVPPDRVVPANPVIVGEAGETDISASWHILVEDTNGDYLTIDLNPMRLGRCYDSFYDRHGVPGSCPIIAQSFCELLERLIENGGEHWYWLRPGFSPIGDAYD